MISVVIPLYNKEHLIGETLRSVFAQTCQDFEVVVVDDGSTDSSVADVEKFTDPRLRLISQANAGVSAARNAGIAAARGEFVALLDGDDLWKPEYLATQMELVCRYPSASVFATNYEFLGEGGKVASTLIRNLPFEGRDGLLTNYFKVAATSHPPICSISIMARRNAFESVGGFPLGVRSGEDLLTWARLACRYDIAYCRKPLSVFRVEGYDVKEKPKRLPAQIDIVGRELEQLAHTYHPKDISLYISHWHKMRSSIYMRLRMRRASMREALKGLRFNPFNAKLYAFMVLNLLPSKLQPF